MKVQKYTIKVAGYISLIFLVLSIVSYFLAELKCSYFGIAYDLSMGIFTGAILTLAIAIVLYFHEKHVTFKELNIKFLHLKNQLGYINIVNVDASLLHIKRANDILDEIKLSIKDFSTFRKNGFYTEQRNKISTLVLNKELLKAFSLLDSSYSTDEECKKAIPKVVAAYEPLKQEFESTFKKYAEHYDIPI